MTNLQNECCFIVVGLFLGAVAVAQRLGHSTIIDVNTVLQEAIALRIFSILTVIGLIGAALSRVKQLNPRLRKLLEFGSLPVLRTGLSTGFAGCGIFLGSGIGTIAVNIYCNLSLSENSGTLSIFLAFMLFSIVWPCSLLATELLDVSSFKIKLVSVAYTVITLYLIIKYGEVTITQYVLCGVGLVAIGFFAYRSSRRNSATR
jgi:hypothetical protein